MVLHTDVLRVQYSCGVVLVFLFWWEIVFVDTYVLSVQYSCAVVSVFWLWWEIVLKMRTRWLLYYDPLALGWKFQFLVPISGTPIGSEIPIPFLIPKIPVGISC